MLVPALTIAIVLMTEVVNFQGRRVTLVDPGVDASGFVPKGEAMVCVQGQPEKDCYIAPKGVGRAPRLSVIELRKGEPALFFEAATEGVSGFGRHFALLEFCDHARFRECGSQQFYNLIPFDLEISSVSQTAWWRLAEISDSQIFQCLELRSRRPLHDGPLLRVQEWGRTR